MTFAVQAPNPVALQIAGQDDLFPVRRVYCVGRNYAAHAREMGFDPDREPPFFFCKPNDDASLVPAAAGQTVEIPYPSRTSNFHYEAELVVAIGKTARDATAGTASDCIFGYAAGLDMTRRDLQMQMREQGRPWEIGKSFDFSAPIGPLRRLVDGGPLRSGTISLEVDGETKQRSDLAHLIWSVDEIIANLSTLFTLHPGDLIFTGTPDGVGPVSRGQTMTLRIAGLETLNVRVA